MCWLFYNSLSLSLSHRPLPPSDSRSQQATSMNLSCYQLFTPTPAHTSSSPPFPPPNPLRHSIFNHAHAHISPKQPASQSLPFHILITTTPPPLLDYDDSQIWNRYRKHGSQRLLSKCPFTVKHHVQASEDLPLIIDANGPSSVTQIFSNYTQRYDHTTRTRGEVSCSVMERISLSSSSIRSSYDFPTRSRGV